MLISREPRGSKGTAVHTDHSPRGKPKSILLILNWAAIPQAAASGEACARAALRAKAFWLLLTMDAATFTVKGKA